MSVRSEPVFVGTKKVYEIMYEADGRVGLRKSTPIRPAHIYNLTGAPGWDKEIVDKTFVRGKRGWLEYTYAGHVYHINSDEFMTHAFVKEAPGFGPQYHVHQKFFGTRTARTVSPLRKGGEAPKREYDDIVEKLPARISFGELLVCTVCKGAGVQGRVACTRCQGHGLLRWKGTEPPSTTPTEPTDTQA